jgi:hypothetical protein
MRTIEKEMTILAKNIRRGGSEKLMWDVWADILEVWLRVEARNVECGAKGPWASHCMKQAAEFTRRLRASETLSWRQLKLVFTAVRLANQPDKGRHVPSIRFQLESVCPEIEQRRDLARGLEITQNNLERWLRSEENRRISESIKQWLMDGKLKNVKENRLSRVDKNQNVSHLEPASLSDLPLFGWQQDLLE